MYGVLKGRHGIVSLMTDARDVGRVGLVGGVRVITLYLCMYVRQVRVLTGDMFKFSYGLPCLNL